MNYIDIGLIIGSVSTTVCLILTLKQRWFKDNALEPLYLWWDGKDHDEIDLYFSIVSSLFCIILAPLFISLMWAGLLPIVFIVLIVLKIRKRNINKNKFKN
tara:strand:- start:759 stop:1061 length:303 start_codon:yes stop_codon:yes gene_type:complete